MEFLYWYHFIICNHLAVGGVTCGGAPLRFRNNPNRWLHALNTPNQRFRGFFAGSSLFLMDKHSPRPVFTTHPRRAGWRHRGTEEDCFCEGDSKQQFSMSELIEEELTEKFIGAAIEVHRYQGPGLVESIYEKSLAVELEPGGASYEF